MSTQREREDKYDVPADLRVTDGLMPLVGGGVRVVQREQELENVYFDTADGDLLRHRVTLRRRRGGPDSGWHVKLPNGKARTEIRIDDPSGDDVPDRLARLVSGVTRGRELRPIAQLNTYRLTHRLLDQGDALLVEVADDTVRATSGDRTVEWREVEIEAGERGDEQLLATIGRRFRRAGAEQSPYPSKLARALSVDEPRRHAPMPLADYLRTQYDRLIAQDVAFRRGRGDVHKARVAVRRLRSTLRTFGPMFRPDSIQGFDDELRWYAAVLGEVRDPEVLREYLDGVVDAIPPQLSLGPVRARIDERLLGESARAMVDVEAVLGSERYFALLSRAEQFVSDAPLRRRSSPAKLRRLSRRAARKTVRRLDQALRTGEGGAGDARLHQARKAAKRARYAAELTGKNGKKAKKAKQVKQVKQFRDLQDILGAHQDSVIAAQVLRELGVRAGSTPGENGFTYGLLLCREQQRAVHTREQARQWLRAY
jgi:CHAD domain-containing protein